IFLGRDDVFGAVRHRRDRVDQKTMGGGDRLVALFEIGMRQQIEDLVRAGAADDAVRIEPEGAADRLAQDAGCAFRIILQMCGGLLVDGKRLRRRPERRLVGGQFEHLAARLRHRALAGGVGRNIEDAGVRHGAGHLYQNSGWEGLYRALTAPFGGTVYRVAWLPTRADERTEAPASIRAVLIFSSPTPVIDTKSAAP